VTASQSEANTCSVSIKTESTDWIWWNMETYTTTTGSWQKIDLRWRGRGACIHAPLCLHPCQQWAHL